MKTLVYLSELSPNTDSVEALINDIIKQAVKNNQQHEVTGVLIFQNNVFMQVLEGSEKNVQSTFEKIQKDARHKNIEIIYQDTIEKRQFPNWQMQLFNLEHESSFSPNTIIRIKQIYEHNLKFNASDFITLLQASLDDQDFLNEINK